MAPKIFTSFQVAKLCGVAPSTVIHWVNQGTMPAYRTPGGHRRIRLPDLIDFLKKYDMPVPDELSGASLPRRKVLIVDDDPAVARMFQKAFLRRSDLFETRAVNDGVEALVLVGKWLPDLVVLDVVMPVIDGMKVCASLKADPQTRHIKIIAVSGKRLSDEKQAFLRRNADAFFVLPCRVMELVETAARLLAASEVSG